MSALHDATPLESELDSNSLGFTSSATPGTYRLHTGDTVDYIQDACKQWFVLRVSYGRTAKAQEILDNSDIHYYQPLHRTRRMVRGKSRIRVVPYFPSLIFVYAVPTVLDTLLKDKAANTVLSYYYNHFIIDHSTGKNPPLTVADAVMRNFIRLTCIDDEHIRIVDAKACRYKRGDTVIVTKGTFEGVIGKLARVSQEQRVVVNLEGVALVATAYIPTAFIESLEEWQSRQH